MTMIKTDIYKFDYKIIYCTQIEGQEIELAGYIDEEDGSIEVFIKVNEEFQVNYVFTKQNNIKVIRWLKQYWEELQKAFPNSKFCCSPVSDETDSGRPSDWRYKHFSKLANLNCY